MSTIEIIIGMMIFLITLCFLTDLLILLWKFSVIAQTTTQVARISGIQGGALYSAPTDWPGYNKSYINIGEMEQIVGNKFATANISTNEWNVKIGNEGNIGKNGRVETERIDYKEEFTIETTVDYRWDFTSNILPFVNLHHTITAKRPAMSEWKYDYKEWDGEE